MAHECHQGRHSRKRYGSTWALHECTLTVPEGHVTALVGPNGAGKTTLLNLAVGLTDPTSGTVAVLGGQRAGSLAALDGPAFVVLNAPLHKNLSPADPLHETRNLNRRFDQAYGERRLGELGIPLRQKAGKMSGGQQGCSLFRYCSGRRPWGSSAVVRREAQSEPSPKEDMPCVERP